MAKITKQAIEALPVGKELREGGVIYRKGKTGGTWWIDYYITGTSQRKREQIGKDGRTTKTEALKALKSRQGKIVNGRFDIAETDKPILFRDFFKEYINHAKSNKKDWSKDEQRGENHLIPEFGNCSLHDVTPWLIEKYKSKRVKEEAAKSTVNREVALLKTVFSKAVLWGKTRENPVKKIKQYRENNRRERYLTEDEAHKIIEAATFPVKYFILIGLNTGMRRGEILGLKWTDIDLEQNIITLRDDKAGSGRKIPINSFLRNTLDAMPHIDETYIFAGSRPGEPVKDLRFSFDKAVAASGIENSKTVLPHTLRHTYASWLAMKGVDLFTIQYLMGHKTIIMTQRYAHLCPDHKRQAVEQITGVFKNTTVPIWSRFPESENHTHLREAVSA